MSCCCWRFGVQKTFRWEKKLSEFFFVYFYVFFSCFNFFAISLFVVRSRFGSLNVSYRWIATLRRLGCNLFFAACSFFRFESFSWEILHQIYWIFFHRTLFNHFSKSLPLCRRAVMLSRCRWCATSQGDEGWGNLLWHTGRLNAETAVSDEYRRLKNIINDLIKKLQNLCVVKGFLSKIGGGVAGIVRQLQTLKFL